MEKKMTKLIPNNNKIKGKSVKIFIKLYLKYNLITTDDYGN